MRRSTSLMHIPTSLQGGQHSSALPRERRSVEPSLRSLSDQKLATAAGYAVQSQLIVMSCRKPRPARAAREQLQQLTEAL